MIEPLILEEELKEAQKWLLNNPDCVRMLRAKAEGQKKHLRSLRSKLYTKRKQGRLSQEQHDRIRNVVKSLTPEEASTILDSL